MRIYCGIYSDELEALLNDDEILDIIPLNIEESLGPCPAKKTKSGPKTFIGKCPKSPKSTIK